MSDDDGFEQLWSTHWTSVVRTTTLVTGDVQEAMDIAQEAFARAYEHWGKVGSLQVPHAWVHRVATNLAISHRRRHRPPLQPPPAVEPPDEPNEELMTALRALSPAQRAVVVLRFHLDWSVDEVAAALGKRPGTVRALTHQGLERLRSTVSKEPQDG